MPQAPKPARKALYLQTSSDYFHIDKHLMRPGRAIHMFTPHQTAKRRVHHIQQPTQRPAAAFQHVLRPMEAAAARRKTPCSGS